MANNNGNENNPNMAMASPPAAVGGSKTGTMAKLQSVLDRFEITIAEANDLVALEDFEMVIIADDSGSMQRPSPPPTMRTLGEAAPSRWDELKETVAEIVEIATCFDANGIDVFFLNRQEVTGIKGSKDPRFIDIFKAPPRGSTPLTETVQRVAKKVGGERPIFLFILTDGEPNGGCEPFKREIRQLVSSSSRNGKFKVQIMACTGDDDEIGWLNQLDHELKEVDVVDDYYSEKQEVMKAGLAKKFTHGDWCMKAMLGPVSHKFDKWDEKLHHGSKTVGCDCTIL